MFLFQDMLKKRQEVERLAASGKHKYEYDSDEDTAEGTWEHKYVKLFFLSTLFWSTRVYKSVEGALEKHYADQISDLFCCNCWSEDLLNRSQVKITRNRLIYAFCIISTKKTYFLQIMWNTIGARFFAKGFIFHSKFCMCLRHVIGFQMFSSAYFLSGFVQGKCMPQRSGRTSSRNKQPGSITSEIFYRLKNLRSKFRHLYYS